MARRVVFTIAAFTVLTSWRGADSVVVAPPTASASSPPAAGRVATQQAGTSATAVRGSASPAPAVTAPRGNAPQAQPQITLPIPNSGFDYQLGGAYPLPAGVTVVSRDRTDSAASGAYSICYVNGFQTQPGERAWWTAQHPSLVLRDGNGQPLIDPDWPDEYILDISTAAKRDAIAAIVGTWIDGCAASGFEGIEIDSLDTYARFATRFSIGDAIALAQQYRARAHAAALAIAQKNATDMAAHRPETQFDFAVVEQCGRFGECDVFANGYGNQVYDIEYQPPAFNTACVAFPQLSIVHGDTKLVVTSNPAYVREAC